MSLRAEGVRVAHPLFQAEGGGASPTSALQLRLEEIDAKTAKALNRLWHSRLPRIGDPLSVFTAGVCYGAEFDGLYYAVAIWTHPVNRSLPQDWLELRRLAIAPDAPRNTASRLLGVMAKLLAKKRPEVPRFISYQDADVHTGSIYRAAGWTPAAVSARRVSPWNNRTRRRPAAQSAAPKHRWDKVLYERTEQAGTGAAEPAGAGANLPLPERREGHAEQRYAPAQPSLWDTSTDDG